MTITDALRLIGSTCPALAGEAAAALRSAGQAQQVRYNHLAEAALSDQDAPLTPDQRRELFGLIQWPESGGLQPRTKILRVRLTEAEMDRLASEAAEAGTSTVADYARRLLFE
jgi:hypothetical protein